MYAFNHGYELTFRKTLDQTQSCMRCTLKFHKMCARDIFPEFMRMTKRYLFNKCYSVFWGVICNELKIIQRSIKGHPVCEGESTRFLDSRLLHQKLGRVR